MHTRDQEAFLLYIFLVYILKPRNIRLVGIEPTHSVWKTVILPLNDNRYGTCRIRTNSLMIKSHMYYHYTNIPYITVYEPQ